MTLRSRLHAWRSAPNVALAVVTFALFLDYLLLLTMVPVLPIYATSLDLSPVAVGMLFSAKPIAGVFASPAMGLLSDRVGRRLPMVLGLFGGACFTVLFAFSNNFAELLVARLLQGVASATNTAGFALLADVFPESKERGRKMGIAITGISLGVLLGPLYGGLLYEAGGVRLPLLLGAGLLVLDGLGRLFVAEPGRREGAKDPQVLEAALPLPVDSVKPGGRDSKDGDGSASPSSADPPASPVNQVAALLHHAVTEGCAEDSERDAASSETVIHMSIDTPLHEPAAVVTRGDAGPPVHQVLEPSVPTSVLTEAAAEEPAVRNPLVEDVDPALGIRGEPAAAIEPTGCAMSIEEDGEKTACDPGDSATAAGASPQPFSSVAAGGVPACESGSSAPAGTAALPPPPVTYLAVVSNRRVMTLAGALFFANGAIALMEVVLPLYLAAELGLGPAAIGGLYAGGNALYVIVTGPAARIGERVGRWRLVALGCLLMGLPMPLTALLRTLWWVVPLWLVCSGLGMSLVDTVASPELADVAEAELPGATGRVFGVAHALTAAGFIAGPLVGTGLLQAYPGLYHPAFASMGVAVFAFAPVVAWVFWPRHAAAVK